MKNEGSTRNTYVLRLFNASQTNQHAKPTISDYSVAFAILSGRMAILKNKNILALLVAFSLVQVD